MKIAADQVLVEKNPHKIRELLLSFKVFYLPLPAWYISSNNASLHCLINPQLSKSDHANIVLLILTRFESFLAKNPRWQLLRYHEVITLPPDILVTEKPLPGVTYK